MPLRPELQVDRQDGRTLVTDPILRRRLDLGDLDLDSPEAVPTLTRLCLLEGAPVVARMKRLMSGQEPMRVRVLPGSRFACQGSGGCCHNYVFGPLTDADVARVRARVGEGFYETRPDGSRFLHTTAGGDCVFLEKGNRCGLHARFGGASKPGFCQLFPIVAQATLSGLRVSDSGECAAFPTSARAGSSLEEQFTDLQDLVPANLPLQHPLVGFAPGLQADFSFFEPLREDLVATRTPREACARLVGFTAALRDGDPYTAHTRYAPATLPAFDPAVLASIATELREVFAAGLNQPRPPPFTVEICGLLSAIAAGDPLPPPHPELAELFALSQARYFHGARALVGNRPLAAVLRLAVGWHLARQAPDFAFGHMLATRRLYMDWPPLVRLFVRREADAAAVCP